MSELTHADIEVPFAWQATVVLKGKRNPTVETFVDFVSVRVPWVWERDVDRFVEFRDADLRRPAEEERLPVHGGRLLMPVLSWRAGSGPEGWGSTTFFDHNHAVALLKTGGHLDKADLAFRRNPVFELDGIPSHREVAGADPDKVRRVLSDDREVRLDEALRTAASLVWVEGHLHSSAYEPVASVKEGRVSWRTAPTAWEIGRSMTALSNTGSEFMRADDISAERSCEGSWLVGDVAGLDLRFGAFETTLAHMLQDWIWTFSRGADDAVHSSVALRPSAVEAIRLEVGECRRLMRFMRTGDRRWDLERLLDAVADLRGALDASGGSFGDAFDESWSRIERHSAKLVAVPDLHDDSSLSMGI